MYTLNLVNGEKIVSIIQLETIYLVWFYDLSLGSKIELIHYYITFVRSKGVGDFYFR